MTRQPPIDAARLFIAERFPGCLAAFLAGSLVRGQATATSDLDILVIVGPDETTFRESLRAFDWPVEVFVQTVAAHRVFAAKDAARRRPSTSRMVCEGLILRDGDGLATRLKAEGCALLAAGPPPLTRSELDLARYGLTDLLDDFLGSEQFVESLIIAGELAVAAADLIVDRHGRWRGRGKWLLRALSEHDPALAIQLTGAMDAFCRRNDKTPLVDFVEQALDLAGGRLWEGFRIG